MSKYPIFSTIGLEYEVEDIAPEVLGQEISSRKMGVQFSTTHDASCESDKTRFPNLSILLHNHPNHSLLDIEEVRRTLVGTELVSEPISLENVEILNVLKNLTHVLDYLGESPQSYRGSVHIHVSCAYNLQILKNIIRLGRWLEDVFFYIGGQGYEFRGQMVNESQYCRPITKWGPQCVQIRDTSDYAQLYTIERLLASKTSREFWALYGSTEPENLPRYHHVRYTWLNLYSLLAHGTLEFRVFNKTLNPHYLNAEVELCRKFTELSVFLHNITGNAFEIENSIYDERPKDAIIETLQEFCSMANVSDNTRKILIRIISRTPAIILPKRYIYSHMNTRNRWNFFSGIRGVKVIPRNEITTVHVQDIHELRNTPRGSGHSPISIPRGNSGDIRNYQQVREIGRDVSWDGTMSLIENEPTTEPFLEDDEENNEEEDE